MRFAVPSSLAWSGRKTLPLLTLTALFLAPAFPAAATSPSRIGAIRTKPKTKPKITVLKRPTVASVSTVGKGGSSLQAATNANPIIPNLPLASAASASFTKTGAGTLTLSGSSSFTGGLQISGGTLSRGFSGSTTLPVNLSVGGATLITSGFNGSSNSRLLTGSGAVMLSGSTTSGNAGGITLPGGTVAQMNAPGSSILTIAASGGNSSLPVLFFSGGSAITTSNVGGIGGLFITSGGASTITTTPPTTGSGFTAPTTPPSSTSLLASGLNPAPIPEPSTALLGLLGLGLVAPRRLRRR